MYASDTLTILIIILKVHVLVEYDTLHDNNITHVTKCTTWCATQSNNYKKDTSK